MRRSLWTRLENLRSAVVAQSALSLSEAIAQYVEAISGQRGRRLEVLLARTGLNGRDPITGPTASQMLGVSPARMYQIQNTLERHRLRAQPPRGVWMPQVTIALEHGWPTGYTDAGVEATRAFCETSPARSVPTSSVR